MPIPHCHGLARLLVDTALAEGKRRGIQFMVLHATQMALPMYEKLGWSRTTELSLTLRSL